MLPRVGAEGSPGTIPEQMGGGKFSPNRKANEPAAAATPSTAAAAPHRARAPARALHSREAERDPRGAKIPTAHAPKHEYVVLSMEEAASNKQLFSLNHDINRLRALYSGLPQFS